MTKTMGARRIAGATRTLAFAAATTAIVPAAFAEVYDLEPIVVQVNAAHPSQAVRSQVENAFNAPRSSSAVGGAEINNLNPINTGDALKFTTTGLVNQPFSGDRFGGGTKIRTFGDWGAAQSIDGLPAIKFADEEGGGFTNTRIPAIAIDTITVQKGGRAVQYGNGSDGGILQTTIKSGRGYDRHAAMTFDANTADEKVGQAELAHGEEMWDVYVAGRWFDGNYGGEPANLDKQDILGGIAKIGFNPTVKTRLEILGITNDSETRIFRGGTTNDIDAETAFVSTTLEHAFTDSTSARAGYLHSDTQTLWPARSRDRSIVIDTFFADVYHTVPITESIVYAGSLGAEYKKTNYLRDNQWDNTFNDPSVKSTNSLTFDDNLVLSAGLRHTWFDNDIVLNGVTQPDNLSTDSLFSWEVGASYSVFDMTRVRGNIASGYNRFYEKYGNFGSDALNPAGAGDEIVESQTYELGINQGWSTGYVDLAWYQTEQENVPRRNAGAIQNVTVEQSGLEFEAFWQVFDNFAAELGYVHLLDLEATRDDGTYAFGNIFFGANGVNIPENQVTLRLDYDVTDEFSLWGAGLYGDGYTQTDATGATTERRPYERIDLGASYTFSEHVALRFRAENVTDEKDYGQTLEGAPVNTSGRIGSVFWLGVDLAL